MPSRLLAFAVLVAALLPTRTQAVNAPLPPGWTEASRTDEVIIFYKENEQAHGRDVLAYTEVDAPPEAVYKVVTDFESYPKYMPYTKELKILRRLSTTEMITYQLLALPWVSDRDFYLQVKLSPGSAATGGVFKSQWFAVPDYRAEREGVVRMRVNEGSWTFEPLDGGKRTRIVYSLLTNLGGSIPNWLVNRSNINVIPNLFKAVRGRLGVK
jgi:hypothetical protein